MKTNHLSPRPSSSSPATSSSMPSVSNLTSEHDQNDGQDFSKMMNARDRPTAPVANALEHDDKRPHAPVAKLLHGNEKNYRQQSKLLGGASSSSFPQQPAAQSPDQDHSLPSSPPTIISSPNITSPHIPAAPPTTPYTPFAAAVGATSGPSSYSNERFFPPLSEAATSSLSAPNLNLRSTPSASGSYSPPLNTASPPTATSTSTNIKNDTITNLLSPPQNPFINDPHTTTLLRTTLLQTQSHEQSRIQQLHQHESSNYTTISEYRHALARERRHSLSLAIQLAHYKFLSRYQSCSLYSNLEMDEEARLNRIIQNVDELKRGMEEEKIRCVMELEREEEGIVNGLMGRLEDVRREKRMLEERVYNSGGSGGGDDELEVLMNLMDRQETELEMQQRDVASLVGPFDRLGVEAQAQDTTAGSNNSDESKRASSCSLPTPSTPSAIDVFPCLKEDESGEEDEEEEEEEDFNDDILGGRYHDAEMEEELEKMLKLKDSKK
mmetsp:Transcript_4529/g.6616  ORF Transcript_4529/g.6616 Transcript_4529/m.6616 type:complete len:495 (-) Transcript_4529:1267-2751(-)